MTKKKSGVEKKGDLVAISDELKEGLNVEGGLEKYIKQMNSLLNENLKLKKELGIETEDKEEEVKPVLYDVEFSSGMHCRNIDYKVQVRVKVSPDAENGEKTVLELFEKCMREFSLVKDSNYLNIVAIEKLDEEDESGKNKD